MYSLKKITFTFLVFSVPSVAYANAGVPMLVFAMPVFLISLIPIIAIETFYISKSLELSIRQSLKTVSISNLVSTIIGIPLTWLLLVLVQIVSGGGGAYETNSVMGKVMSVTWQAPWLMPDEENLHWMIPTAGLVLLIPFFYVSWWSEYLVSKKLNKTLPKLTIKDKVRNANLITYFLLAIWPIGCWV